MVAFEVNSKHYDPALNVPSLNCYSPDLPNAGFFCQSLQVHNMNNNLQGELEYFTHSNAFGDLYARYPVM